MEPTEPAQEKSLYSAGKNGSGYLENVYFLRVVGRPPRNEFRYLTTPPPVPPCQVEQLDMDGQRMRLPVLIDPATSTTASMSAGADALSLSTPGQITKGRKSKRPMQGMSKASKGGKPPVCVSSYRREGTFQKSAEARRTRPRRRTGKRLPSDAGTLTRAMKGRREGVIPSTA